MEQLLTKLKAIEPNKEFKERSRTLILNSLQTAPQPRLLGKFINTIYFSTAIGLAAIFIFLIGGGLSVLNQKILSPAILSSLNPEHLNQELKNLDIQIQLSQAEYYENSAAKIEVALQKTSEDGGLNQLLKEITL